MKFAIILLVASIAYVSAQAQPLGGSGISPFAAANPYAAAFNPFLNGVFGGGAAAGAGAAGGAAAAPAPSFGFGGASVSTFFQSVVLQREAERLLSQPNFPSDLSDQVLEVVASSEESIANCGNVALPWLQIRCVKPLLNTAKNQFKVIDDEFKARQTAAASPAA